jgi:hypothetical protein
MGVSQYSLTGSQHSAGVGGQPDRQVVSAVAIQERVCQDLQLLQRQLFDAGGGGLAQGAAATVELAEGESG